ncbi:MAG TPA: rRNA maturation RNase YbeY [Stellaceae bacterium]|jgi:probable rRNA maturation factor|nr:rRNA maturation RNase YbeY [Stellaceae bacterium]
MNLPCTIDVTLACVGWTRLCPAAESLARSAADLALARGTTDLGLAWQGTVELGITLADATDQRRLNRDYRGQDAPTNVLAFPGWEAGTRLPPGAPVLLGDVVLDLETVAQEAAEQEKPLADHLVHLTVHGVLHLLGYDHLTHAQAATMESLERSILAELGVPDPYRVTISSIEPDAVQP